MSKIYEIELEDGRTLEIESDGLAPSVDKQETQQPKSGSSQVLVSKYLPSVEQGISERPSMIKSMAQGDPTTLRRFMKHPLGTTLRTAGGALEYLEGIPSSIGLALQRGKPEEIIPDVYKTLIGERPSQRGDIMRAVGTPEPIAAAVGLMAGSSKYAPETAGFNAFTKGVGGVLAKTKIPQLISKFGKEKISKVLSVISQTPEDSMEKALSNPNYLKSAWLKKEGSRVKDLYKKVVQPLLDDSSKQVDISDVKNIADDLGLVNKSGDWTKNFTSLKPGEARKILKWEQLVQKNKMSFNEVDSLIGEMDSALKSVYRTEASGKAIDYSDDFLRMTRQFRNKMNTLRKVQYKEAGKVLSDYETLKTAETVYKNFDRWLPHLMPAIVGGALATMAGVSGRGMYAPLTLLASPKVQDYMIRGASSLARNVGKLGAAPIEVAFEQWRKTRK